MIAKKKLSRIMCLVPALAVAAAAAHLVSVVEGETSGANAVPQAVLAPEKPACQAAAPADIVREYYDTGEVKSVFRIKNGLRNGPAYHFFRDGDLKGAENWIGDVRDGRFAMFFDGGGLRCMGVMKADKLDGRVCYFTADRTLKFIETYENGASVGREYK